MDRKILIIAPTSFFSHRGCHIRILEEIKSILKKGWKVKVTTYHIGDEVEGIDIRRIPNFFWYRKEESGPSWHKIYLDFFLLIISFIEAIKIRPKVIHCHLHEGALIGILIKFLLKKKVVFDSQGSLVDELSSFGFVKRDTYKYKAFLWIEKLIYRYSDEIVVSNENNLKVLKKQFFVNPNKITLIPDGIREEDMNVLMDETIDLIIPENKRVLVYLGTMNKVEGIDSLIFLLSILRKKRNDFFVLMMGYPNVEHYKEIAMKSGLADDIMWLGKIDYRKIYGYLSKGDIAISLKLPTSEGNGKLLNYALIGLPIVCYDHISNRSILGSSCYYLDINDDMEKQAADLSAFMDMPASLLSETGEKAKKLIVEKMKWDSIIDKLIGIYLSYG